MTEQTHTHEFQADVARLLHLMVHSIYSDKDIFLRELISNAADACEKLRYEALSDAKLNPNGGAFAIKVILDKANKHLIIEDNGIGMNRGELVQALGTIANSGTRAFLEKMESSNSSEEREIDDGGGSPAKLIGQFGIGFYSAFMVADKVDVETHRAGSNEAFIWSSEGKGNYSISPLALDKAPACGTRVILHINEQSSEYLDSWRLQSIIKEHSGAIAVPIDLLDEPGAEAKHVSEGSAIWTKSRSDIKDSDYTDFYRTLAGQFDEPALTVHWRAEGRQEFTVLAFIPGSRPLDLFEPERKGRAKLYVRNVLINADCDLLPGWLRFFRLIVDSADLPLNVSREMIQQSPVFAAIRKAIINRLVQELAKKAESDPEGFAKIWENFGAVIKEGLYEDPERRDQIFKFCRFATSRQGDGTRTLANYVGDLRPNQNAIYYVTGENTKFLASSPQLEAFKLRDIEVLLLADPVDAFWVTTALGFEGKPFKSITQGALDIKSIPLKDGESAAETPSASPEVITLLAYFKQVIGDEVEEVRPSERLSTSAACLVASDKAPDRRLEQILSQSGRLGTIAKPILEINAGHHLIASLAKRLQSGGDKALIDDAAWLLLDEAQMMDGEKPKDLVAFSGRLTRVMQAALE